MADKIEGIKQVDPVEVEVDGEKVEVAAGSVQSVTTETPHPADESSQPGPYDGLDVNRPPVSTNDPETPIAHSLLGGAGAPTGEPEIHPETHIASNAYLQPGDNVQEVDENGGISEAKPYKASSAKSESATSKSGS